MTSQIINENDSKRQRKSFESFVIVDSGHHCILDFRTSLGVRGQIFETSLETS